MASPKQQEIMRRLWANPRWRAKQLKQMKRTRVSIAKGEGYIYAAVIVGTDIVKLGFSINPDARIVALHTQYKMDFDLLGQTPGKMADEMFLHGALRAHRHPDFLDKREFYPRSILTHSAVPAALRSAA
jgi:hypothetical protein